MNIYEYIFIYFIFINLSKIANNSGRIGSLVPVPIDSQDLMPNHNDDSVTHHKHATLRVLCDVHV